MAKRVMAPGHDPRTDPPSPARGPGRYGYNRSFSEKSLTGMMQHWTRQAGIPDVYTLHGLRRTFGIFLAECNIQARAIMEAMGHSSMTVTDDYVREANKKRIAVDIARAINEREAERDVMKRRAQIRVVK